MIVCIDPGHGGRDPGGGTCSLFRECDMTLKMSLYQEEILRAAGHQVVLTRREDVTLIAKDRAELVKESGADVCISNHINNVTDPRAHGLEVFHSIHSSPVLAQAVADAILKLHIIGPRSGQIPVVQTRSLPKSPTRDFYFMIRETGKVQTLIIEYGFASNKVEAQLIDQHWQRFAEAAIKGLIK